MMIRLPKLSLIFLTVVAAFVACEKKENASSKTISDGSKVDLSSFIPEHEISTEEIEPGDRLSVLVEVENPGDLDELQRLNFGGNSIYLEWDKKREGLYAEFVASEFNSHSEFDLNFELHGHSGAAFIRSVPEEELEKTLLKFKELEEIYESFSYLAIPELNVIGMSLDKESPKIRDVKFEQLNEKQLKVTYLMTDLSGNYHTSVDVRGEYPEWTSSSRRYIAYTGSENVPEVKVEETSQSSEELKEYFCEVVIPMPKAIPGTPQIGIDVWDVVGNRDHFSSDRGDFEFTWPSRAVDGRDLLKPIVYDVDFVSQNGRDIEVDVNYRNSKKLKGVYVGIDFVDENGEYIINGSIRGSEIISDIGNTARVKFTLPEIKPSQYFKLKLSITGENGVDTLQKEILEKSELDESVVEYRDTRPVIKKITIKKLD